MHLVQLTFQDPQKQQLSAFPKPFVIYKFNNYIHNALEKCQSFTSQVKAILSP